MSDEEPDFEEEPEIVYCSEIDRRIILEAIETLKNTEAFQQWQGDLDINLTRGVYYISQFADGDWWQ